MFLFRFSSLRLFLIFFSIAFIADCDSKELIKKRDCTTIIIILETHVMMELQTITFFVDDYFDYSLMTSLQASVEVGQLQ